MAHATNELYMGQTKKTFVTHGVPAATYLGEEYLDRATYNYPGTTKPNNNNREYHTGGQGFHRFYSELRREWVRINSAIYLTKCLRIR